MKYTRMASHALVAVTLGVGFSTSVVAAATDFPQAPIRIVLTLPPGGSLDLLARTLSEPLSESLGKPVIVENRPGAGGNLAAMTVARAPADGHTLLFTTDSIVINPLIYADAGFTTQDFIPVAGVGKGPQVISASGEAPYRTLSDLVNAAKAAPGTIAYGSAGSGQASHLAGEQLKQRAQVDLMHVPYRGSGPSIKDAIGGQIPVVISSPMAAKPHFETGRLHPLAVTSKKRVAFLPDVPTVAEQGWPEYISENWSGIFAPAGTPPDVVTKLGEQIGQIVGTASFQNMIAQQGFDTEGIDTREGFQSLVTQSQTLYEKQVKALSLTIN